MLSFGADVGSVFEAIFEPTYGPQDMSFGLSFSFGFRLLLGPQQVLISLQPGASHESPEASQGPQRDSQEQPEASQQNQDNPGARRGRPRDLHGTSVRETCLFGRYSCIYNISKWHGTCRSPLREKHAQECLSCLKWLRFTQIKASLLYVTKWHETDTGDHFLKSCFKSVFHEVARDYGKSRLCYF